MALFSEVFREGLIRSVLCSELPGFGFFPLLLELGHW